MTAAFQDAASSFAPAEVSSAKRPGGRFEGLDALRGLAAASVVAYHTVALNNLAIPLISTGVIYRLGMAVPLFYMLSAFSLSLGYYGRLNTVDGVVGYGVRRFLRIAPLFYAVLPIWLCVMWFKFHQAPNLTAIVGNLTFLFNLVPGLQESIAWAGWSVGVEMIFYGLLPLIFLAARGWRSSLALYAASIVAAIAFQHVFAAKGSFAYMSIVSQLPHFMLGLVAFHVYRTGVLARFADKAWVLLVAGMAIWPLMALFKLGHLKVAGVDVEQYVIALAFPLIVLSQVLSPSRLIVNRLTLYVGQRSFGVYLLHPLAILATQSLIQGLSEIYGVVGVPIGMALVLFLAVGAASVSYALIEAPCMNLGRRKPDPQPPPLPVASI
jgi:peptidoglycan/LPS O-acetylase OafA/YrhL